MRSGSPDPNGTNPHIRFGVILVRPSHPRPSYKKAEEDSMSLASYRRVQSLAEQPRATEQRLFAEVTADLSAAWEAGLRGAQLMPALHRNRELWSTLSSACLASGNELPETLRAGIVSLALWVDRHTSDVVAGREPMDALVEVNRSVMEGLAA